MGLPSPPAPTTSNPGGADARLAGAADLPQHQVAA